MSTRRSPCAHAAGIELPRQAVSPAQGAGPDADHPDHGARARAAARAQRRAKSTSSTRRPTSRSASRTSRCCATTRRPAARCPRSWPRTTPGSTGRAVELRQVHDQGDPAAVDGIDSLLGNPQLRGDRDAQLLDVRARGAGAIAKPHGAGAERLAGVPGVPRRSKAGRVYLSAERETAAGRN